MTIGIDRLTVALADRYTIERELGQGGMATVYLAHDIKHGRKVAIKVLKPELAAVLGADRFVVEIKTTAALQHPHILPLFDSGSADGFLFYVMPFIDGETLRTRLDRETQLGIEESVRITSDVASALHYAHQHGVIHRDIKPENILLHDGRPMVADFGIALAVSAAAGGRMTETGLSIGTPHYMSPEQATAEKEITGRSDVYSLGSVLYEMLTGNPPHTGASAQQIIMKIIVEPVEAVTRHRKSVPPNVAAAVAKSLEKLPADRFATAKEFSDALSNPGFITTAMTATGSRPGDSRAWIRDWRTLVTIGLAAIAVIGAMTAGRPEIQSLMEVFRLTIEPDAELGDFMVYEDSHGPPRVSPDGKSAAFAGLAGGADQLLIRRLDRFESRVIPGGGTNPFYSPDGSWLGFARGPEIWRVAVEGGDPVTVGSLAATDWYWTGYVWHPGGTILVTTLSGLWSLPEAGGAPVLVVAADSASGEVLVNPVVLDDERVMVEVRTPGREVRVAAISLRTGERAMLPDAIGAPVALVGDLIVFGRDPVRVSRFDRGDLSLIGVTIPVPGVHPSSAVSPEGSLSWFDTRRQVYEPVWVTPSGSETPLGVEPGKFRWPRLSPTATTLAFGLPDIGTRYGVWASDLRTGTRVRLGTAGMLHSEPVWTPTGSAIVYAAGDAPNGGLLMQAADAQQAPDTLYAGAAVSWPTDISSDGAILAYYGSIAPDENDLFFLTIASRSIRRESRPRGQRGARFSPDMRWLSYQSTESGRSEIYVQPWPALDTRVVVSNGGGREPIWSRNGERLFYRNGSQVLAVEVLPGVGFVNSPPREILRGGWFSDPYGDQSWDVASDGRFLFLRPAAGSRVEVKVVRNWIAEVQIALAEAGLQ